MEKLTLKADRNIQTELEKALMEPVGTLELSVTLDDGSVQNFSIVQLHDIDTKHPERQRYDLHFLDSGHVQRDLDFVGLSGAIEYSVFMPW